MLRLSRELVAQLEMLVLKRHAASISVVLAEAWPELTQRLQARWPAFVEAAVQQGRRHGFLEARALARYACLWCIWGPAFDSKPAFEWARDILADPGRSELLKLHQLTHRTEDELRRRAASASPAAADGAPPVLTAEQFATALAKVDARIEVLAAARDVFPVASGPLLVKACDIAGIDMMVAEPEAQQDYRRTPNGWHRTPSQRPNDPPVRWLRAPDQPVMLALTSHGVQGGPPARLNLRVDTITVCDPSVHPEVLHVGTEGRLAWRGLDTARLSLALYAAPAAPVTPASPGGPALPSGIAHGPSADLQRVSVTGCGLRDAGAPFGPVELQLSVFDAAQWLVGVSHPAWQPMVWPAQAAADAPRPVPVCTLEKDGVPVDVVALGRAWAGLHADFRAGLERLYNEWVRALDGQAARLEVEASPLVGQAAITWGWTRVSAASVLMRTEGTLDMLAMSIDLRLSGELVEGSARSRIRLHCKGRSEMRMTIAQLGEKSSDDQSLKAASRSWRFPFSLEIEPVAGAEPATLGAAAVAVPITGALVGECGLRPRADAAGHQWFFALRSEPVDLKVELSDPVLGSATIMKKIFPALSLVDWSAG